MNSNESVAKSMQSVENSRSALVLLSTWGLCYLVFVYLIRTLGGPGPIASAFMLLDSEPPLLSMMMLSAGYFLVSMPGTLATAIIGLGTLAPYVLGARGKFGTILYASLTLVALLGLAGIYFGLWLPGQAISADLEAALPVPPKFR